MMTRQFSKSPWHLILGLLLLCPIHAVPVAQPEKRWYDLAGFMVTSGDQTTAIVTAKILLLTNQGKAIEAQAEVITNHSGPLNGKIGFQIFEPQPNSRVKLHGLAQGDTVVLGLQKVNNVWSSRDHVYKDLLWSQGVAEALGKVRAVAKEARTKLLAEMLLEARQSPRYFVAISWMESGPIGDVEVQLKHNLSQANPRLVAQSLFLLAGPFERARLHQAASKPEDGTLLRRLQPQLLTLMSQSDRLSEPMARQYLARLLWELREDQAMAWIGQHHLRVLQAPPPITQALRWEAIERARDLKLVAAVPVLRQLVTEEASDTHAALLAAKALLVLQGEEAVPVLQEGASKMRERGPVPLAAQVEQLLSDWRAGKKL